MRHSALALILSAPVVCLAFAPKRLQTRGALKLSSIATVDVSSPAAKELDIPAKFVKGDSMKIMKYIMNLPEQNVGIMWRRAKRYNAVAEWQLRD